LKSASTSSRSSREHVYFRDELKWETDDKYYIWGNVQPMS